MLFSNTDFHFAHFPNFNFAHFPNFNFAHFEIEKIFRLIWVKLQNGRFQLQIPLLGI